MTRSYLDHASCSPLRPEAVAAMTDALTTMTVDPGRMYQEGLRSRAALEVAREQLAQLVGARNREVVFTASASEAIASACLGAADRGSEQIVCAVEHSAVRLSAARHGTVIPLAVDADGRAQLDQLDDAITDHTAIVHVQWANHEVGTRQPIEETIAVCRERGVLVHVDAAQGIGHDAVDFDGLGADLMSLSGPKFGAPMGTGALLIRRGLRLTSLLVGGDQERARRAGLENVVGCIGLGAAAAALSNGGRLAAEDARARAQSDRLAQGLVALEGIEQFGDPANRISHLVCFGIADVEPQAVLLGLDQAGIAAHSGSSCATESLEPSPVLDAMGIDAAHSLRLSVGWSSTEADIDAVLAAVPTVLERLRALWG